MNLTQSSSASPSPKDIAGFNVDEAVARMFGNPDLWWRALAMFSAHYGNWDEGWRQSQSQPHAERKCVHALRSPAVNLGADRLAAAASALEDILMQANPAPETLFILRAHLQECYTEARLSAISALSTERP